jgi:hypothetical protein
MDLADDPEPVRLIARNDVRVDTECRFKFGEADSAFDADHLDATAEYLKRTLLNQLVAEAIEEDLAGVQAVVLLQRLPRGGVCRLDPGGDVLREQRPGTVVILRSALCVKPSARRQIRADLILEREFFVDGG